MSTSFWKTVIVVAAVAAVSCLVITLRKGLGTAKYENEETYKWLDYKGRDRQLTVIRNAKVS